MFLPTLALLLLTAPPTTPQGWLRQLIPLPHEITLGAPVDLAVSRIGVQIVGEETELATAAAALLNTAMGKSGEPGRARDAFTILLGRCTAAGTLDGQRVPGAERLKALKYPAQAYAIASYERELVLTALDDRGLYHGASTLAQLLAAGKGLEHVTFPRLTVVDWPDLDERGEWGGSCVRDIEWMAALKMNLVEVHSDLSIDAEGHGKAVLTPSVVDRGRTHAVKVVPIITHLDQLDGSGIFERFPECLGKGATTHGPDGVTAACFGQPKTIELLSDWMVSLAQQPGVGTICIWLGENGARCGCDQCKALGQYVLETRACARAWELAKQRNPRIQLRILLTQGSYPDNTQVIQNAPADAEITYYDGGRTYDSSRDPMIYPLLTDYAKQGRWLGVYPQLTASWRIVCPWPGPQFIRTRMNEFVDKGLRCLCGYATPDNRLYDFNIVAAAEWTWNAKGRDEREFARAWATRRGLKDVEQAAEWAVTLGPVGWDVYGSGVPFPQFFGAAARLVSNRQAPVLGKGPFRYFPSVERFAEDQAACRRAQELAKALGDPDVQAETDVISGYVTMLEKLYGLAAARASKTPPSDAERQKLAADLAAFSEAESGVSAGLRAWEQATDGGGGSRLSDTVNITEQTAADVSRTLAPLGIRNPWLAYMRKQAGSWTDDDFEAQQAIRKVFDVTGQVDGPGTYEVTFVYTKGWNGLTTRRAALATAPGEQPEPLAEVAVDQHDGVAAYQNKAHVYTLKLEEYDPAKHYFLVVDIGGVKSSDRPPSRRGCQGDVLMGKVRQPGETVAPLPLGPVDPAELARYGGPKFTTTGLHVAVVQGGYGSESVLAALRNRPGIEAQGLWGVSADALKDVQVLIVPQPRDGNSLTPQSASLLTGFAQAGGGLILTHDAVGFRACPILAPEVCAGGVDKVRDQDALVAADHPVTAGLTVGRKVAHTYYDCIAVKPGTAGQVLVTTADGKALVVCGPLGKGRVVACGLAIGIAAADDSETAPTADELTLLVNAVKWTGGR